MYGLELKITREKFIDMCQEYYNQYNFNWTVENGISPRCVNSICEKYDIAHYVFDISKKCFIKNISNNRNHKALIYFAVNNHMYLIVEDAVRKSLVEKTKVKESFSTSLLENEEERENKNIYDTYNIIVNVNLDSIFTESKDTIINIDGNEGFLIKDIFNGTDKILNTLNEKLKTSDFEIKTFAQDVAKIFSLSSLKITCTPLLSKDSLNSDSSTSIPGKISLSSCTNSLNCSSEIFSNGLLISSYSLSILSMYIYMHMHICIVHLPVA
jgi:hypothetical protein